MQLHNLINRRNISAKMNVQGHVNEVEDFLKLVVRCHILAVVMHHFGMEEPSDEPKRNCTGLNRCKTNDEKWSYLKAQLYTVVKTYVIPRQFIQNDSTVPQTNPEGCYNPHGSRVISEHSYVPSTENISAYNPSFRGLPASITNCSQNELQASCSIRRQARDGVLEYASAVLNDGLLFLEFCDAIREGDGERILRCWKAMLIYFHSANHSNYAKEAIVLQAMVNAAATPRVAAQMTWSCVVNTTGGLGRNIPVDLENEHLNRIVKTAIANVGANVSTSTILQCGKSLKALISILQNFDSDHPLLTHMHH